MKPGLSSQKETGALVRWIQGRVAQWWLRERGQYQDSRSAKGENRTPHKCDGIFWMPRRLHTLQDQGIPTRASRQAVFDLSKFKHNEPLIFSEVKS